MLETIREYARERLAESGEGPALRRRHLGWVSDLAQRCLPGVLGGRDQVEALDVLDSILDDVRSALEWGATNDEAEAALELATSMARFWVVRGHAREGRAWYERLLARPGISDDARSLALLNLGSICVEWFADLAAARLAFEESIALNRVLGRRNKVGLGLMNMGLIGVVRREPEEARPFLEEALAIARDIGDEALQCQALGNLGIVHRLAGDDDRARSHYEEATALFRARGDLRATAIGLSELARLAGDGDPASSAALFGEAIELFDKVGDRGSASLVRVNFAVDRCRAGDLEGAESVCVRALRDGLELEMLDLSAPVELLATIAVRRGDHLRAAALYGLRDAMRRTLGERAISEELDETPELIELTRSALGDVAFGAAWQDGSTLPPSAALEDDRIGAP
jgi:tetratricopeptide (TPR) repeat protein